MRKFLPFVNDVFVFPVTSVLRLEGGPAGVFDDYAAGAKGISSKAKNCGRFVADFGRHKDAEKASGYELIDVALLLGQVGRSGFVRGNDSVVIGELGVIDIAF